MLKNPLIIISISGFFFAIINIGKPVLQNIQLNLSYLKIAPLTSVSVIVIIAMIYILHYLRNKSAFTPPPGLNNGSHRVHPLNDPVAARTHWQSIAVGASNFQMQQIEINKTGLKVKASFEINLFCWAFIMIGLAPIIMEYVFLWQRLESLLKPLLSAYGIFFVSGVLLKFYFTRSTIEFNEASKTISTSNKNISFNDVYALQVISSISGGRGNGIFRNNELNLVLNNGQRINVLNHGGKPAFEYQELQLSKLLNVPVWQA